MTERETELRRTASVLGRSLASGPDDDEHPAYELLEALVEDRIDAADREVVLGHIEGCQICAEDIDDLSAARRELRATPAGKGRAPRWRTVMVAASIAAGLVLAVWFSERQTETPEPSVAVVTGPLSAPPEPAAPVSPMTPDERAIVSRVNETGRLELPAAIVELAGSVGTLLGPSRERSPLSPIAPAATAVLSARPVFSWQPLPGTISYTVAIFDERFVEVARSPRLKAPTWTPATDLPAGRTLAWQITAELATGSVSGPAPPQPEARFRVIDTATAATVVDQLARLANEPLALGILLAQAGLFEEASRVLTRAAADPTTRPQSEAVLAELRRVHP